MREEANKPSFKFPSSNMHTDLNLLLQISDAFMKRLNIDLPSYQASVAKSYLWISFVILSAAVGFFFKGGLQFFVSEVFDSAQVNLTGVLCLFCYLLCIVGSLRGFWCGMSVSMGNDYSDAANGITHYFDQAKEFRFDDQSSFEMKEMLLIDYKRSCARGFIQAHKRGHKLRKTGFSLFFSIVSGLLSLIFYGACSL